MRSPLMNLRCLSQKWASGIITDKKNSKRVELGDYRRRVVEETVILSESLFDDRELHLQHVNLHKIQLIHLYFSIKYKKIYIIYQRKIIFACVSAIKAKPDGFISSCISVVFSSEHVHHLHPLD